MYEPKACSHENETPFMTEEKRVCPKCGQVYFYDPNPIDWEKLKGCEKEEIGKINVYIPESIHQKKAMEDVANNFQFVTKALKTLIDEIHKLSEDVKKSSKKIEKIRKKNNF